MMLDWLTPALLRRLPGNSAWFGPPRRIAKLSEYKRDHTVEVIASISEKTNSGNQIQCYGPVPPIFHQLPAQIEHQIDVCVLDTIRVLGPDSHLIARGDYLLQDFVWRQKGEPVSWHAATWRRRRRYPRIRLKGSTLVLGSDWSCGSYAHFLADALGRWIAVRPHLLVSKIDQTIIYAPDTDAVAMLLAAAKLPGKIIRADPGVDYECEKGIAVGFPHPVPEYSPAILRGLRELLAPRTPHRLIYLSRDGFSRHPGNAPALESLLLAKGFEIISSGDHLGAIKACAEARIVIGAEGSNLFNTIFAPASTRVIMLLGPNITIPYIPAIGRALDHRTAIIAAIDPSEFDRPRYRVEDLASAVEWSLRDA